MRAGIKAGGRREATEALDMTRGVRRARGVAPVSSPWERHIVSTRVIGESKKKEKGIEIKERIEEEGAEMEDRLIEEKGLGDEEETKREEGGDKRI